nr:hypothetical protein [Tanacetum cinerariifolium]
MNPTHYILEEDLFFKPIFIKRLSGWSTLSSPPTEAWTSRNRGDSRAAVTLCTLRTCIQSSGSNYSIRMVLSYDPTAKKPNLYRPSDTNFWNCT